MKQVVFRSLNKINNSKELLELIKECCSIKSNWKDDRTLVLRLAFGVKRFEDDAILKDEVDKNGKIFTCQMMNLILFQSDTK